MFFRRVFPLFRRVFGSEPVQPLFKKQPLGCASTLFTRPNGEEVTAVVGYTPPETVCPKRTDDGVQPCIEADNIFVERFASMMLANGFGECPTSPMPEKTFRFEPLIGAGASVSHEGCHASVGFSFEEYGFPDLAGVNASEASEEFASFMRGNFSKELAKLTAAPILALLSNMSNSCPDRIPTAHPEEDPLFFIFMGIPLITFSFMLVLFLDSRRRERRAERDPLLPVAGQQNRGGQQGGHSAVLPSTASSTPRSTG